MTSAATLPPLREDLQLFPQESDALGRNAAQTKNRRTSLFQRSVHHYLFFRIPLVHPHRMLGRLQPHCEIFYSCRFWIAVALLACAGVFLVSREWDRFVADIAQQLQWSGVPVLIVVLAALKTIHELGHAVTATRYGCHVSSMGVAFMVLAPVLYTDTTDAWRVPQKRRRIIITSAGVMAEMIVAVAALCLWPFLTEGLLRQMAVTAAIAAPLMTLAINLNPCMRFDGYFILSDVLGVENLQDRSFALARWRLRELLFHPCDPCPESFPKDKQRALIVYAWAVWIYRLILFTGIALFVYAFFIKLVGIALFVIEILWFVLLPIWREMQAWWRRRSDFAATGRSKITLFCLCVLLFALFWPWSTSVHLPAMLARADEHSIHAVHAGRIARLGALSDGARVSRGEILLQLDSPELGFEIAKTETEAGLLRLRIARIAADKREMEQLPVLRSSLRAREEKLAGLQRMRNDFVVRAASDGIVLDLDSDLHVGRWLKPSVPIAMLAGTATLSIRALASEADVTRLAEGAKARFIPGDGARPAQDAIVTDIDRINETFLTLDALAFQNGGWIPAARESSGKLRPAYPVYNVRLAVKHVEENSVTEPAGKDMQVLRGVVVVDGRAESFATKIWRRIARVAIRESGF